MEYNPTPKKWLIFTIEIASRELVEKLIIAKEALKSDWGIIFGGRKYLLKNMKSLPTGVFFVKSASKIDIPYIYAAKFYGHKVVCQDAEGLVQYNYDYFAETRIEPKALDLIDIYFTWGDKQASIIKKKYPTLIKKIKSVGNPRIELWKSNNNINSRLNNKYGDNYIAIPTSFGEYNHYLGLGKGLDMEKDSYRLKGDYLKQKLEYYKYIKHIYYSYLKIIPVLARKFNKINFLIKVHPSEEKVPWENIANKFPNVIIYDGSTSKLLKNANIVLQTESTTAIEAYLNGKIVLSYCPIAKNGERKTPLELPMVCSIKIEHKNRLIELINILNKGDKNQASYYKVESINNYLSKRIKNFESNTSSKDMMKYIEELDLEKSNGMVLPKDIKRNAFDFLISLLSFLKNRKIIWHILPYSLKWRINCNIIIYGSFKAQVYEIIYLIKNYKLYHFIVSKKLGEKIEKNNFRLEYGKKKRLGFNKTNFIEQYKTLFKSKQKKDVIFEQHSKEIISLIRQEN